MQATEVAIIIGAVSALIVAVAAAFFKYLNRITEADRKERIEVAKINSDALKGLGKALADNTQSNRDIADATKQSAKEAKERNGHLAELQIKSQEMIDRNAAIYEKGIKEILCQKVKKQTVDEQVVKHSTEE